MEKSIHHSQQNLYEFFFSNKTRKTYTNLGISLILVMVLLIFALRPTILTIGRIREKIKQYEALNKNAEEKIEASRKLSAQLTLVSQEDSQGLKEEIDFLNSVFLDDPNIKLFYANMYERSKKGNVAIKSLTPKYATAAQTPTTGIQEFELSPESPSGTYYNLNINVESKEMKNIESFIQYLEGYKQFPVFSRVESLNVINQIDENKIKGVDTTQQGVSNVINVSVSMIVYLDSSRITPIPIQ